MKAEMMNNLESVGDMVGSLLAMSEGLEERPYLEGLIRSAHSETADAFDLAAAATGNSGFLSHVYEFGVSGITGGPARFPDPTSPAARLWTHTIVGRGGDQTVGYMFRPATQPNPEPTPASTGVASIYLRHLSRKKYVFWNKAYVMETGQEVKIKGGNGWVFVPFRGEPSGNPKNVRGYMMWNSNRLGPLTVVPGQQTAGTFTGFWMEWWGTAGQTRMEEHMRERVTIDTMEAQKRLTAQANAYTMKPTRATNIMRAMKSGAANTKRYFGEQTKLLGKRGVN